MRVLSIDPSINNVGWAVFDTEPASKLLKARRQALKGEGVVGKISPLLKEELRLESWTWGTFQLGGTSLQMRIIDLVQQITMELGDEWDFIITEKPAFYSSQKGQIAAHQNYTIDIAAVGFFVAGWFHMDQRTHHPITAITWKGSVSKEITARHFFRIFGKETKRGITEHSIDAVMLLRYWLENWAVLSPLVVRHTSAELIEALI